MGIGDSEYLITIIIITKSWLVVMVNTWCKVRWSCLQAQPRLCADAQGESQGWWDQQDDLGEPFEQFAFHCNQSPDKQILPFTDERNKSGNCKAIFETLTMTTTLVWTRWAMWRTESVFCSTTCLTPVAPSARWEGAPSWIMIRVWIMMMVWIWWWCG